jgi:hypothetical protein
VCHKHLHDFFNRVSLSDSNAGEQVAVPARIRHPITVNQITLGQRLFRTPAFKYGFTRYTGSRNNAGVGTRHAITVKDWVDLRCHPSARPEAVRAIQVLVGRSAGAELRMTFRIDGDISRLSVPSLGVPRIGAQLWRHTCFEAFIAVEGQSAYHEFNFAPSTEWAVYAFTGYRNGGPLADEMTRPQIAVRSTARRLELDALVRLDRMSPIHSQACLRVGLSTVIEASDGFSYWALRHPMDKPDFHNADGFVLRLEPPGCET